jgi:hypothetical protein
VSVCSFANRCACDLHVIRRSHERAPRCGWYRALEIDGWTLCPTYDDISCQANEPIKLEDLYWRT